MKNTVNKILGVGLVLSTLAGALEIKTHTAGDAGFRVNSHLILGSKEAILIDAQFTRSEAEKVVLMVRNSGRILKKVYITHGHPDHYFGLEVIKRAFPSAAILASEGTVEDIKKTAKGKHDYWKPIYKSDLADEIVVPEVLNDDHLTLEDHTIRLMNIAHAESENATVVFIPVTGALITGDLAYSGVHLWLAEGRPNEWLKALENLKGISGLIQIYPGHGAIGGIKVLCQNENYIRKFQEALRLGKEGAKLEMLNAFPEYQLPIILDISLQSYLK